MSVVKKPIYNSFGSISHFDYIEIPEVVKDNNKEPTKEVKEPKNKKVK